MNKNQLDETTFKIYQVLVEKFGESIGDAPSLVGVADERESIDEDDENSITVGDLVTGAKNNVFGETEDLDEYGSMSTNRPVRPLGELEEGQKKKRRGPSKKTAKKILKGTKTFKDKIKKVSGWAENPAAAAAWMMHKATGKWPSEK